MREHSFEIKPFPPLRAGVLYRARVIDVRKDRKPECLRVVLENLEPRQCGRRHEHVLPLPLHPEGPAAQLLEACSIKPIVGAQITRRQLLGRVVGVKFLRAENGDFLICEVRGGPAEEGSPQAQSAKTASQKPDEGMEVK